MRISKRETTTRAARGGVCPRRRRVHRVHPLLATSRCLCVNWLSTHTSNLLTILVNTAHFIKLYTTIFVNTRSVRTSYGREGPRTRDRVKAPLLYRRHGLRRHDGPSPPSRRARGSRGLPARSAGNAVKRGERNKTLIEDTAQSHIKDTHASNARAAASCSTPHRHPLGHENVWCLLCLASALPMSISQGTAPGHDRRPPAPPAGTARSRACCV